MAKFKIPFEKTTTGFIVFEANDKAEAEKYERALMYGKELVWELRWDDSFYTEDHLENGDDPEIEHLPGYSEVIKTTNIIYGDVK